MKKIAKTIMLMLMLGLAGCGQMSSGDPDEFEAAVRPETQREIELPDGRRFPIVASDLFLPTCSSDTLDSVFFVEELKNFRICTGEIWDVFHDF